MSDQISIQVLVKRELFRFTSHQDWVNRAQRLYANCGVRKGQYVTVDAKGHVMHMGRCFAAATKINSYPISVYELQTNWDAAEAITQEGPAA